MRRRPWLPSLDVPSSSGRAGSCGIWRRPTSSSVWVSRRWSTAGAGASSASRSGRESQTRREGYVRQGGKEIQFIERHGLPFFDDLVPRYCFSFTKKVFEGCLIDPCFSCVRTRVRVFVRVCMCVWSACASARMRACVCVCVCVRARARKTIGSVVAGWR